VVLELLTVPRNAAIVVDNVLNASVTKECLTKAFGAKESLRLA
jgi:hypothetical protein